MTQRLVSCSVGAGHGGVVWACVFALAVGLASGEARADQPTDDPAAERDDEPDGRALAGPAAGALTMLAPLAAGGALWAHDDRPDLQRKGAYVMLAGFAAAPLVAHAITGRWRRALGFGLLSLGTTVGTLAAMGIQDPFDPYIANRERLAFGTLLTASLFAAAVGVVDSIIIGPEPRKAR